MPDERDGCRGVCDIDTVLERFAGDAGLVREMAELFVSVKDSMLAELAALASAGDCAELGVRVHALKGVALNFEGADLRLVSAAGEKACAEGRLEDARNLVPTIAAETERLAACLRRFLERA